MYNYNHTAFYLRYFYFLNNYKATRVLHAFKCVLNTNITINVLYLIMLIFVVYVVHRMSKYISQVEV